MGTILKNVVRFTGLVVGAPASQPHLLNVNGIPVPPRIGGANNACFTITADPVNVTVTRTADAGPDVDVYVEHWHTIEAVVPVNPPPGQLAGLVPLFFASCGGGGGGPTTEHVSGEGGVDPTVPLDPFVDTSFLTNTGASETNQVFFLPNGTVDGQIHNLVNDSIGARAVQVIANLRGGTGIGAGFENSSAVLIWNEPAGEWVVLGAMLGFALS